MIDTKLGSRAAMHTHPFFELGFEQPAQETQGRTMLGTIGWTGNFQFTFEVDNVGNLRVIPAINPYASDYELNRTKYLPLPNSSLLSATTVRAKPAATSTHGHATTN